MLIEPLTPRELEVLRLLADGLSTQEIADRLIISRWTARRHCEELRGKLAARSLHGAVGEGYRLGLLVVEELDVTTALGRQAAWRQVRQLISKLEES